MYCEDCGHPLNENGICPICGYNSNANTSDTQANANIQQNSQPVSNLNQNNFGQQNNFPRPNVPVPQQRYQQPNVPGQQSNYPRPSVPVQQQGYPQPGSPVQQNNYGQQPNYSGQMPYGQMNNYNQAGTYGQPAYTNPYSNAASQTKPKKSSKKKWAIISGIVGGLAVIGVSTALILNHNNVRDYTTTEGTTTEYVTTETTESTTESTTETTTEAIITGEPGSKTIMMYMVGSDLESEHAAASDDIQEIIDSNFNDDSINFLIYTGGCSDWDISDIPDGENTTFLITDGDLQELDNEGARNMGDADTLSDFLTYGYENYPAEQYSVIFWNHGGGSFSGFGYDELTEDSLTLIELSEAFGNSPFNESNKLEWIGFDACLMATIETADALSPYSKYLIASQEPEPSWGWDYSFLADIDDLNSGADIGTKIVDEYIETTEGNFLLSPLSYSNITLSVLDLSYTDDVETALNALFAKADDSLNDATFAKYSRIRSNTKELASMYTGEYSFDVVDMVDLAKKMETEFLTEATALESALSNLIVYNNTNEMNANGVSIYYPYNAKQYSGYYIPMYHKFNFATDYADYIENFTILLTGEDTLLAEWDPQTMIPVANGDLTFSLQLTPEQAANCQNVYYVISRADTENPGNYVFVSMSTQVDLDSSNVLTANFDGQIIYMQNDTTLEQYEVMYTEQEATNEYTRYLLSSILFDESIEEEDAMYAYFVLETTADNPQGEILGAYPISNLITSNGTEIFPERYEIDINEYQQIAFGTFTHEFTSDEDLTNFNESDWSDLVLEYNYFPISEGFSTVMGGMMSDVPYYGMFIIEDSQGNRHCSNLVQIQ